MTMANAICLLSGFVRRVRVEKPEPDQSETRSQGQTKTHTELQSLPVNACDARRIKLDFYCHRYYIDELATDQSIVSPGRLLICVDLGPRLKYTADRRAQIYAHACPF